MNFEKKNNIYKAIMLVLITALITFLLTSIGMYNYLNKGNGLVKTLVGTETSDLDTKIQIVRAYLDELYLGEINEDELVESAVKGYVAGLGDEYTEYLTKSEYEELMIDVNGNYVGIGVYMTQDIYDNVIVLLPIEGSPAEAADLRTGDIIKKVARQAFHINASWFLPVMNLYCLIFGHFSIHGVSTVKALEKTRLPVLFIHGKSDDFVPFEMSSAGYASAGGEKELLLIDGAGHGMSYLLDTPRVSGAVKGFLKKYS